MARSFNGAEYIQRTLPALSPPFTLAGWFKANSLGGNRAVVGLGISGTYHRHDLTIVGSAVRSISTDGTNGPAATSSTTATVGTWNHAAGVWTTSTSRAAYLNGGGKATNSGFSNTAGVTTAAIGAIIFLSSFGEGMDGDIGETAIWTVALTDEEVGTLARGVSPTLVRPQSLLYYVPLVRDLKDHKTPGLLTPLGTTITPHPRIILP
jgi:hypothetical protein